MFLLIATKTSISVLDSRSPMKYHNFNEYAATDADYLMYLLSGKFPVMTIEFLDVSKFEVTINRTKFWYLNEKLHRVDGPAIEFADGTKDWWLNGYRHREDGPSLEDADGTKAWYLNDKLHREDGPAIEDADGTKEWYLNGKQVQEF